MKDELLLRIAQDPDDVSAYLVLADALTAAGDPQGRLIALQHAASEKPNDVAIGAAAGRHLIEHKKDLLGALAAQKGLSIDWRLGFVDAARVYVTEDATVGVAMDLLKLPVAKLIRELVFFVDRERVNVDALRKQGPPTLKHIHVARQQEVGQDEVIDPARALWLKVEGRRVFPKEVLALPNVEWLEVGFADFDAVPPEIARLPLRRFEVGWSDRLSVIPEKLFGIETLEYFQNWDCPNLEEYPMGRINTMLAGFAAARTPSKRRIIEAHMLLGNDKRVMQLAGIPELLAALDSNVASVRELAVELLTDELPDPTRPLAPGASFAVVGSTNFDKKHLAGKLAERGAELGGKVTPKTTHVLVGEKPNGKQFEIGDRTIAMEQHLKSLFKRPIDARAAGPARAKKSKVVAPPAIDPAAVRSGLESRQDEAALAAITALGAAPIPDDLLVDVVMVAIDPTLKKARTAAKKLLAIGAREEISEAIRVHLKTSLLQDSLGETQRTTRIAEFCDDAPGIDPIALALRLVRSAGVGLKYLFEQEDREVVARALEHLRSGDCIDLSARELRKLPDELADVAELRELRLARNHLQAWPNVLQRLTRLERLDLSSNPLGSVPVLENIALRSLSLRFNRIASFPESILALEDLEDLDLSTDGAPAFELPSDIGRLKRLRRLRLGGRAMAWFPPSFFTLSSLEELDLMGCSLPLMLEGLSELRGLKRLGVAYSGWVDRTEELAGLLPGCTIETREGVAWFFRPGS